MISTTSWVSGGQIVTVTTTSPSSVTTAEHEAAHAEAIRLKLLEKPKDP